MRRAIVSIGLIALATVSGGFVYQQQTRQRPLEWSGTVEAHTIDVGSRVGGRISAVLVREGDAVRAGQALVIFEPGDLMAQRLQALGQVAQAEAILGKIADARVPTARRAEIAAARARLDAAQVAYDKAQLDSRRVERLFLAGATTQADRDNADSGQRNARAQVATLQAQLEQLEHSTPQDAKLARGQLDVARGKLQQIDVMIAELTVRAPCSARIEALALRPGDLLAANATAVRLLEPDALYVRVYVPETQLGHLHLGAETPVRVDSFGTREFPGVVEFISSEGEFMPRNLQTADERADHVFAARVRLGASTDVLRAGMAAVVRVPL